MIFLKDDSARRKSIQGLLDAGLDDPLGRKALDIILGEKL